MDTKQIEASDLAYQRFVLKQLADAQAVVAAWRHYVSAKYRLGLKDSITENGEIRIAMPEAEIDTSKP